MCSIPFVLDSLTGFLGMAVYSGREDKLGGNLYTLRARRTGKGYPGCNGQDTTGRANMALDAYIHTL